MTPERLDGSGSGPFLPAGKGENEPSPTGFRVEIKDPEEIYKQLKLPTLRVIGSLSFSSGPIKKIMIFAQGSSSKDVFSVTGRVRPKEAISLDNKTLSENLRIERIRDYAYVIGGDGKREYGIKTKITREGTLFVAGSWKNVAPRPIGDFESFGKELKKLATITEILIRAIYRAADKELPNTVLVFQPEPGPERRENGFETDSLRGIVRERALIEKPRITFKEIGGQREAKREIQSLVFALTNPELYQRWGTRPPKGILLTGPPGNGKTLLAKALAAQADATFFNIKLSDIVSKWYGEAERLVKAVFEEASNTPGKTIIFFDELDGIAPHRGESHEASAKMVSTMLVNIDGLETNPNVLVVAATNRPEAIDLALLRPGRFDQIVEVPLPDKEGRGEILAIHIRNSQGIAARPLFENLDMEAILEETEGFSGADLAEVVRRTLEGKVRLAGSGQEPGLVTSAEVLGVIERYERAREIKRKIGFV